MDIAQQQTIVMDGLLELGKVLKTCTAPTAEEQDAFARIAEAANEEGTGWFNVVLRTDASASRADLYTLLFFWLRDFYDDGAAQLRQLDSWTAVFDDEVLSDSTEWRVAECAIALAWLHRDEGPSTDSAHWEAASEKFQVLSDALTSSNSVTAATCCNVACNMLGHLPWDGRFSALIAIYRLSVVRWQAADDVDHISQAATNLAMVATAAAQHGADTWAAAFDAVEDAILRLAPAADQRAMTARSLRGALAAPQLAGLRRYLVLAAPEIFGGVLPLEAPSLGPIAQQIAQSDGATWLKQFREVSDLISQADNDRLLLGSNVAASTIQTKWHSFAFQHPAFLSAVPHGESLLDETRLNELLLELRHEITHVFSMSSHIGMALVAIRAAVLDIELSLWHFAEGDVQASEIAKQGVATIPPGCLTALPQVEQTVELIRKAQILQEIWNPWLEGIAVFAEHAEDPTADAQQRGAATEVLCNLLDYRIEGTTEAEITASFMAAMEKAEALYAAAIRADGKWRLWDYLRNHFDKYGPGYLAVRSVVSAWRQTVGRSLTGCEAARALLHVTRWGTREAVPDLSLPLDQFAEAAAGAALQWLRKLTLICKESLDALQQAFRRSGSKAFGCGWTAELALYSTSHGAQSSEEGLQHLFGMVKQAHASLTGARAPIDRVQGPSEICIELMRAAAEALTKATPNENLVRATIDLQLRTLSILPVGSVEAPFWLERNNRMVFVTFRVNDARRSDGKPRYDAVGFSLNEEEFAKLLAETRRLCTRRMTITRCADLVPASTDGEARGFGRNLLVFRHGDWLHIQPRGLIPAPIGEGLRYDVGIRCNPPRGTSFESEIIAQGVASARRTLAWLEATSSWQLDDTEEPVDVAALVDRVRSLANDALAHGTEPSRISDDLLEFSFGNGALAAAVRRQGVVALAPALASEALRRLLDESGRAPVCDLPPGVTSEMLGHAFERNSVGWDLAPPTQGG